MLLCCDIQYQIELFYKTIVLRTVTKYSKTLSENWMCMWFLDRINRIDMIKMNPVNPVILSIMNIQTRSQAEIKP